MDGRLKRDRQELIDEWGDLPPEARLYIMQKTTSRRFYRMSRGLKALAVLVVLIAGGLAMVATIQMLEVAPWPVILVYGILIGIAIGQISKR